MYLLKTTLPTIKSFNIVLLLFVSLPLLGQSTKLSFSLFNDTYSWRNKAVNPLQIDSFYFAEPNLDYINYKTYVRYINGSGQILDIYSNDNKVFKATLTNYITNLISVKSKGRDYPEDKEYQYVWQKIELDSVLSTKVAIKLLTSGIDNIPTDSLIKLWKHNFLDCTCGVGFYIKHDAKLEYKRYSCLCGQDSSVNNVRVLKGDVGLLTREFNLDTIYTKFEGLLPRGKLYSANGFVGLYISTIKEGKAWEKNKPYRDYLESVKDTLRRYLEDTLSKLFKIYGEPHCYNQFFLKFSPQNKLVKVTTNSKLRDSYERKEFNVCRKAIVKAFTYVHVDFVKSKVPYLKELDFDSTENKVFILQ